MKFALLLFLTSLSSLAADKILVDALLARVGREPILYSDLLRFQDIEPIVLCGAGKSYAKKMDKEPLLNTLGRYVEGELIYQELKTKKTTVVRPLRSVIDSIMDNANCRNRWLELGSRYARLWSTPARPREGEALLVKELEKRLAVHDGESSVIEGDREAWLRGAKIRLPIKLFIE